MYQYVKQIYMVLSNPMFTHVVVCLNQKVSLNRKYHNHTLQTNLRYREEEPLNTNSHKTSRRQFKVKHISKQN